MKLSAEAIRDLGLISGWATAEEIERLRKEFDPPYSFEDFCNIMRTRENWSQMVVTRNKREGHIERVFDCKPLNDQLRLYVSSDLADEKIIEHTFQTE